MPYTKDRSLYKGIRQFEKDSEVAGKLGGALYSYKTMKLDRTRTGDSLPDWKQRVSEHRNATTVMSATFSTFAHKRCGCLVQCQLSSASDVPVHREHWGDVCASLIAKPTWLGVPNSKADARATAKFYSQVRQVTQKMSGPTFLGELRETLQMLRRPAAGLWDGLSRYAGDLQRVNRENRRRYFRKDKPRYERNLAHSASGLWLENAFGWQPFINDIQDAKDAFNSLVDIPRVEHISAGGQDMKDYQGVAQTDAFNKALYFNHRTTTYCRHTVRYRGAVKAQAATTAADRLARFGFQPSEFIPTAWELLPWSFLVDYFANIGDILNSAVTDTSQVAWVSKSILQTTINRLTGAWDTARIASAYKPWRVVHCYGNPGDATWTIKTVQRSGTGIPSLPSLNFSLPRSAGQLANVAALLAQVGININPQKPSKRNYRL